MLMGSACIGHERHQSFACVCHWFEQRDAVHALGNFITVLDAMLTSVPDAEDLCSACVVRCNESSAHTDTHVQHSRGHGTLPDVQIYSTWCSIRSLLGFKVLKTGALRSVSLPHNSRKPRLRQCRTRNTCVPKETSQCTHSSHTRTSKAKRLPQHSRQRPQFQQAQLLAPLRTQHPTHY